MLTEIVACPECGKRFSVTYDSSSPDWSERHGRELAISQLKEQCPDHGR